MQHFLEQITEIIARSLGPERIFLLGTISSRFHGENIFTSRPSAWEGRPSCHLLVLVPVGELRHHHELEDLAEAECRPVAQVVAIVRSIRQFNEWLAMGHPFAATVYRSAHPLYNANTIPLKTPPSFDPFIIEAALRQEFQQYIQRSREFLAAAVVQLLHGQLRQAAYSARESAEKALTGCILWITGLQAGTASIDKLYRYARMLSPGLATLFPQNTEREKRLFLLLDKADMHTRYEDNFKPADTELELLMQRIRHLQLIAGDLLASDAYHTVMK